MFVIELAYTADLAEIDRNMAAHVRYLKKHYAARRFVVSGRKIPDPFCARGLAEVRIVQFRASQRASDIQARIDGDARTRLERDEPAHALSQGQHRCTKVHAKRSSHLGIVVTMTWKM